MSLGVAGVGLRGGGALRHEAVVPDVDSENRNFKQNWGMWSGVVGRCDGTGRGDVRRGVKGTRVK